MEEKEIEIGETTTTARGGFVHPKEFSLGRFEIYDDYDSIFYGEGSPDEAKKQLEKIAEEMAKDGGEELFYKMVYCNYSQSGDTNAEVTIAKMRFKKVGETFEAVEM